MFEWLFAHLESFQERHLEPQDRIPERLEEAWLLYRIERLERRVLWLFRLVLLALIVDVLLWLF